MTAEIIRCLIAFTIGLPLGVLTARLYLKRRYR